MYWVAIEDADICEISEFEERTREEVLYLFDLYKVTLSDPTRYRERAGKNIIYEGVTYKGGFGYNVCVARKFIEA